MLAPEIAYDDLDGVSDGGEAATALVRLALGAVDRPGRARLRARSRYCRRARAGGNFTACSTAPGPGGCSPCGGVDKNRSGPGHRPQRRGEEADLARAAFFQELLADGLRRVHVAAWATQAARPEGLDAEVALQASGLGWHSAVLRVRRCLLYVSLGEGRVTVRVAHRDDEELARVLAELRAAIPESTVDERTIPVTFWAWAETHSDFVSRQLEVPSWEQIRGNYSERTRHAIEALARGFTAGKSGQLILWTGEPGTGKTWAIRALAWEWRAWGKLHYITDPEQLLGLRSRDLLDAQRRRRDDDVAGDRTYRNLAALPIYQTLRCCRPIQGGRGRVCRGPQRRQPDGAGLRSRHDHEKGGDASRRCDPGAP